MGMQSRLAMAGKDDPETNEILGMLENATGIDHTEFAVKGSAASAKKPGKGGGTNAASLTFLKTGLGLEPEYYMKGDKPKMPKALKDAGLTAQILGPPPLDELDFMKLMDLKKGGVGQYLGETEDSASNTFDPFGTSWHADASEYPDSAFREFDRESKKSPGTVLETTIQDAQPSMLFTAAKTLDNFLNNQSLVVFFTFKGKKLLFAGDAQGGNWEY